MKAFVAMPYGIRTAILDPTVADAVPVTIDFDDVWHGLIEPALPEGWTAFRADELNHPGLIDQVYIERLLDADLVVADITFANPNVYYELGIRQALSPRGTLLIAHRGTYKPFDVRNQTIEEYVYAGGVATDGLKFVTKLKNALLRGADESRSPVHLYLPGLFVAKFDRGETPDEIIGGLQAQLADVRAQLDAERDDTRERVIRERIRTATSAQRLVALASDVRAEPSWPADVYESLATGLRRFDRVRLASEILREGLVVHPDSAPLLREQGFCARVLGHTDEARASFERALTLTPNDTELLGMMGGLYKRAGDLTKARASYEKAIAVDPEDLYPLLALCGLLVLLSDESAAMSNYRAVLVLTDHTIAAGHPDHWTRFARGEAFVAQRDIDAAIDEFSRALADEPPPGDIRSELDQLRALRQAEWRSEMLERVIEALERGLPPSTPHDTASP
jgi:tetratricopeptide (TPR) repeat protein